MTDWKAIVEECSEERRREMIRRSGTEYAKQIVHEAMIVTGAGPELLTSYGWASLFTAKVFLCHAIRRLTSMSLKEMAKAIGAKSHTTVHYRLLAGDRWFRESDPRAEMIERWMEDLDGRLRTRSLDGEPMRMTTPRTTNLVLGRYVGESVTIYLPGREDRLIVTFHAMEEGAEGGRPKIRLRFTANEDVAIYRTEIAGRSQDP